MRQDPAWLAGWRAGHKEASKPVRAMSTKEIEERIGQLSRELERRSVQ